MGRCTSAEIAETSSCSADFSGHLWKQGNSGRWRLQYFILQGTKLSWFMPTSRPHTPSNKRPLGSIQLDGALVEPIAIGCLSDMEGLGRISMTTADAPAGIPPWGIAVEACGAGHSSHSAQRLVLAADSQKLRDLWLDVIHYETVREPGTDRVDDVNRAVEERANSLSEWQPQPQAFLSQAAEASRSSEGPTTLVSTWPGSDDTAQRSQRRRQRQQQGSGCGQPRLLRCFTAHGTRSLVLHNTSPALRPYPQGGAVGPYRPSSASRKQADFWNEVLGVGPDQSHGRAAEVVPVGSGAEAAAVQQATGRAPSGSAGSTSMQGEARISMSEWCRRKTAAGGQPVDAAAVHLMPREEGSRAVGSVQQECSSAGWSVSDNEAFDSLGCQPEDRCCLGCGVGSVAQAAPGQKGAWRVRDNASFDDHSCQDPQAGEQAQQGLIPLPAFEGKQVGSGGNAGGMDPMCHVENWLSSSLASVPSSANVNSSRSSSSGLQSAAIAFANASSGSSGQSLSRSAGIGSMSSERAQELLGQYQRLLSSVQSVRQHLQVPEQGLQAVGEVEAQPRDTGSSEGGNLLRVQLGSLEQATGRMREVLSSLQENRQMRRQQSRAHSYQH